MSGTKVAVGFGTVGGASVGSGVEVLTSASRYWAVGVADVVPASPISAGSPEQAISVRDIARSEARAKQRFLTKYSIKSRVAPSAGELEQKNRMGG